MDSLRHFSFAQLLPRGVTQDDLYLMLICVVVFLCFLIIDGGQNKGKMGARIRNIRERRSELRGELVGPKKRRRPETSVNFMRAVVMRLQFIKTTQLGKTESELIEAGFRSKDAIYVLGFFNLLLPIVLGLVGFVFYQMNSDSHSKWATFHYIWPILGAYIGFKLPWYVVHRARKKRYLQIQRALSDVLDLMTICAEAGLSLAAMLERVSRELGLAYPVMAQELALTSIEIGFLPDRNKALTNLSERCKLPEIRGIVSVLIQTEKYGTPIAQALRVLSAEFRQARMLRAEQKAARLPALMTIPMITCILPVLFIVIISPAIVKLLDTFAK